MSETTTAARQREAWMPKSPRFTADDAERAYEAWGCNCGPSALAAIIDMTLDQVRPHMGDFEKKHYTNPTLMFAALKSAGANVTGKTVFGRQPDGSYPVVWWPVYGLARIQWEGPWTEPGVPIAARYRHTHWVGAARNRMAHPEVTDVGIFDVNCLGNGTGWTLVKDWADNLVPYLLKALVPRANGLWHITHSIEIERPNSEQR